MSDFPAPEALEDLIAAYCDGLITDPDMHRLEGILLENQQARRAFVEAFQFHSELLFAIRARRASDAVLQRVLATGTPETTPTDVRAQFRSWWRSPKLRLALTGLAACLVLFGVHLFRKTGQFHARAIPTEAVEPVRGANGNIAWLVNAQDCQWAETESDMPGRDMRAGKLLRLNRGLAEIEFDLGARVILQGPAELELVSGSEARLLRGTLTARVPPPARGFTILAPRARVVDLGTEFGLSVDQAGATTVRVFTGVVAAFPLPSGANPKPAVTIVQNQSASIDNQVVALSESDPEKNAVRFIRSIEPPPIVTPRTLQLDFTRQVPASLEDADGRGIGLTHRLPGTGTALARYDPNLHLETRSRLLKLTTTRSDLNTQDGMPTGEYLGVRLSDLGFTGREDFEFSATIPKIPRLDVVGQFGVYVGANSTTSIRGGLISRPQPDRYGIFLVNNVRGLDSDYNEVGLMTTGDDLRLALRRIAGRYTLVVENQSRGNSSTTLAISHPSFLDHEQDLYAGLFGANTQSDLSKTLTISELKVTVWTSQPRASVVKP
jgi:hypothetical protein